MNLADKAAAMSANNATIAENQQKVYDSGVSYTDTKISEINAELEKTLFGTEYGGKSWYDWFWDTLQDNGNRRNYWGAFTLWYWTDEIFKPKYPLIVSENGTYMFYSNSAITHIPEITFTAAQFAYVFQDARKIEIIDKITLKNDGSQQIYNPFGGCKALRKVRFEGIIGDNISFQDSTLLSVESILSIVNALSSSTTGKTLTLSQTAVNNADWTTTNYADWDSLIATKTNWTFSLV